ncbi:MAG: hypothetical protein K6L81_08885 [Agarilytica sp.]
MNISSSVTPYTPPVQTQRAERNEQQEKSPPQQAPSVEKPEKASSQLNAEQLRSVEKPNLTEKQSRIARENERQERKAENPPANQAQRSENEALELRPVVIEQAKPPATQAFLDVANPRDDFQVVDLYV